MLSWSRVVAIAICVQLMQHGNGESVLAQATKANLLPIVGKDGATIGLHKKVVVQRTTKIYESPSSATGRPVSPFAIFYKLRADASISRDWVRVGLRSGMPLGWIKRKDVGEWNSRLLLTVNPPTPNNRFTLYKEPELQTKVAQLAAIPSGTIVVCPIQAKKTRTNGVDVFEVDFFGAETSPRVGKVAGSTKIDWSVLPTDLVFVVDAGVGSAKLLDVLRQTIRLINMNASNRIGKTRVGLIAYRASKSGNGEAEIVSPLTDNWSDLTSKITQVTPRSTNPGWGDMLIGVAAAMDKIKWTRNAFRQVIVLGNTVGETLDDASQMKRRVELVIDQDKIVEQLEKVHFHAGVLLSGKDKKRETQWRRLYISIASNQKRLMGGYWEFNKSDVQETAKKISNHLVGDKIVSPIRHAIFQLLVTQSKPTQPLKRVWAAVSDSEGKPMADVCVMLKKREMRGFKVSLRFVAERLKAIGPDSIAANRDPAWQLVSALQREMMGALFGEFLSSRANLANCKEKIAVLTPMLKMTKVNFAALGKNEFQNFVKNIEKCATRLDRLLDNSSEWIRSGSFEYSDDVAFLRLQYLP